MAKEIDYSLYLVTGRELLPPGIDYYDSLESSLKDGKVTVVQLREKLIETDEFLRIAERSLEICDRYNIPMLINDNLSVVLALPERVGLHIGQTDLPVSYARKLLGPNRILGLSVHNAKQAQDAVRDGIADYVGVGPCYGTKSKAGIEDKDVLTVRGARQVIECLKEGDRRIPSVLIGGINERTAGRALFGTASQNNAPDGIAVISAIVGQRDPATAGQSLAAIVAAFKKGVIASTIESSIHAYTNPRDHSALDADDFAKEITEQPSQLLSFHRASKYGPPLIQTLTSHVSSTLSANIALAFSASPIMSHQETEADDLSRVTGAVVLNIGTIGDDARRGMKAVGNAANRSGKPVVLDPVGVGASAFRRGVVEDILNETQITLLKGNAAELSSIAGLSEVKSRGVDSGDGRLSDPVGLVKRLAQKERCLVLLTGKVDYLTDGRLVVKILNGHPLLGKITGSGCALGVVVAAGMAAACNARKDDSSPKDKEDGLHLSQTMVYADPLTLFIGALMGVLAMTIASEVAAERSDVKGPGSFIPALIDELAALSPQMLLERQKIEIVS
ncbi:hypothetical protein CBS101457_002576 [Exobasidium rhododendri]|nr:hypothetical protein CBS101457_002576 [Exobasidium rhododendri]